MQNRNENKAFTHTFEFADTQTLRFWQNHRKNNERREEDEKKLHLIPDFELVLNICVSFSFFLPLFL